MYQFIHALTRKHRGSTAFVHYYWDPESSNCRTPFASGIVNVQKAATVTNLGHWKHDVHIEGP